MKTEIVETDKRPGQASNNDGENAFSLILQMTGQVLNEGFKMLFKMRRKKSVVVVDGGGGGVGGGSGVFVLQVVCCV